MRIDLVFPKLPPALDGIGDYTARLAAALAEDGVQVRVLTAQEDAEAIPGVNVERAFSAERRGGVGALLHAVQADPPDWLVLQFNQFSYGRWGLNPFLPLAVRRIKQRCPEVRIAVMFHEDFVPVTSWRFAVMTLWQRAQFWVLGRSADLVFFSIEPWVRKYGSWFPDTPMRHLPVGSNMPHAGVSKDEARRRFGIDPEAFVAGVFGSARASRLLGRIQQAAEALHRRSEAFTVLYVGPHGAALREALGDLPLVDAGRLPPEAVSAGFSAMDVHLAPFADGVSTRRGSFMAGLQHGVATISTDGPLTDPVLHAADGTAMLLAPVDSPGTFARRSVELLEHPQQRAEVAAAGRALYGRTFAWEVVSKELVEALREISPSGRSRRSLHASSSEVLP